MPFFLLKCKYCQQNIKRKDHEQHETVICGEKPEICAGCHNTILKKVLLIHTEKCPDVIITCTTCELKEKRSIVDSHSCAAILKKCLKESNERLKKLEELQLMYGPCNLCKCLFLKSTSLACDLCKQQVCSQCIFPCIECKKLICKTCDPKYCIKCQKHLCKICSKECYNCKKIKCLKCNCCMLKYHWMDGSFCHTVKQDAVMSTKEALPQCCKITLKLLTDNLPTHSSVGITSKQYNCANRTYEIGASSESVECGWHWSSCGGSSFGINGPHNNGSFGTGNFVIKAGDIVEIILSKERNFEVKVNGVCKGIACTNLGTTHYYLAIGTSTSPYCVEIIGVEEII